MPSKFRDDWPMTNMRFKNTHFDDVTIASWHFGPGGCFLTTSPIDIDEKMKKILLRWPNMLNWMLKSQKFMTSLIFMRWCHDQMKAIFGYTFSQLRYTAKLKPNEITFLLKMEFEICHFKALSRDTWWRHDVFKTTTQNFSKGFMHLPSLKKIKICSMAKMPSEKTVCFVYGIFPTRKRRRRN